MPAPFSPPLTGAHVHNGSLSGVVTLTPPDGALYLVIQCSSPAKNVRMTFDGQSPSATLGMCIVGQDPPVRIPVPGKTFKVIEETSGAAIDYYWEGGA